MTAQVIGRDIAAPLPGTRGGIRVSKQLLLGAAGLAILLGAAGYGYQWWVANRFVESTDDAYVGGDVTPIAPQVPVTDNQRVQAGQTLVRLDSNDYKAALDHANAALKTRLAELANLHAKR